MANRDVLCEVLLQMENLKLSSPLRTEHNEDDNKENVLGGQDLPKLKSVETTSCSPTSPIFPQRNKTPPTQLNGTIIKSNDVNTKAESESSPSLPELKKSLRLSEVENSSAVNFEENPDEFNCHNGSLNPTITENGIEFNVHLNGDPPEFQNCTFISGKTNCENTLNSTFDVVNSGVDVIVENLGNTEKQECLNTTFAVGENEYILHNCSKDDYVSKELVELSNNKKVDISSVQDVSLNLNTINDIDEKREIDKLSEVTFLVPCTEEKKLSSDNNSVQAQAPLNDQKVDSVTESEVSGSFGDSLVTTKTHSNLFLSYLQKENSVLQNIVLGGNHSEDIKLNNHEDENFESLKSECSVHSHSQAELSDVKKDIDLLNNSSIEASETPLNVSSHEFPSDSKEGVQDCSVSPSQNEKLEGQSCTSNNHSNLNETEICDQNSSVPSVSEESQTYEEVEIEKVKTLDIPKISEDCVNITTLSGSPETTTEDKNSHLPECKQNEIEIQPVIPSTDFENQNFVHAILDFQDSEVLIPSHIETHSNAPIIGDLTASSIDNHIEDDDANQLVDISEIQSDIRTKSPQTDISLFIHSNSLISQNRSEGESNSREYSKTANSINCCEDLTPEDILPPEESSFISDYEIDPNDVTVINKSSSALITFSLVEPEECTTDSEISTVKANCVEEETDTSDRITIVENTVEEVSSTSIFVDPHAVDKNYCVEIVEEIEKPDKQQALEKTCLDKVSVIPESNQVKVKKMTEINEKLQQDISDLKLELNASKQAKACLELEIGKKDEIILKTQAEAIKKEQHFHQELKSLKEQLKEKSSINEKDSIKDLEEALKESKAKESQAVSELNARMVDELNYRKIMEEYEKTIAAHIADFQKLKEENKTVTRHLANLELSFSDLHQKYERTKTIIDGFKNNEEKFRTTFAIFEDSIHKQEEKYESLKAHAKAQIEKSNKEIIKYKEKYDSEVNKLNAIIKRLEIKSAALETSLDQKSNECIALAALCDEVTGKKV